MNYNTLSEFSTARMFNFADAGKKIANIEFDSDLKCFAPVVKFFWTDYLHQCSIAVKRTEKREEIRLLDVIILRG
jgi:hypothetical protein